MGSLWVVGLSLAVSYNHMQAKSLATDLIPHRIDRQLMCNQCKTYIASNKVSFVIQEVEFQVSQTIIILDSTFGFVTSF